MRRLARKYICRGRVNGKHDRVNNFVSTFTHCIHIHYTYTTISFRLFEFRSNFLYWRRVRCEGYAALPLWCWLVSKKKKKWKKKGKKKVASRLCARYEDEGAAVRFSLSSEPLFSRTDDLFFTRRGGTCYAYTFFEYNTFRLSNAFHRPAAWLEVARSCKSQIPKRESTAGLRATRRNWKSAAIQPTRRRSGFRLSFRLRVVYLYNRSNFNLSRQIERLPKSRG